MNTNKPKILLIYTGGTIGMVKDTETGSLRAFDFDNIVNKIPELQLLDCEITAESLEPPIDSSNMNPDYWVNITDIIEQHYDMFDGFVVLHGSDTMSYTASALSFMLEHLAKPVIFTGSQLPIGDLRTDAKENLITSIQIASLHKDNLPIIQEVCLYFEYKLYRANRTTKINAEHFEAFASLNYPELVESGVHLKVNYNLLFKPDNTKSLIVRKALCKDIAIVKLFPGMSKALLDAICNTPNLKGVILETYGSGNCSTEPWFLQRIEAAIQQGIYVVNVTQCSGGSVIMGNYETSVQLKSIGVVSGHDITTEAAVAKLMYLLGQDNHAKDFKINFERSLRGEIT